MMTPQERQQLVERRKTEFGPANAACGLCKEPGHTDCPYCRGTMKTDPIDFAPPGGRCYHCRGDLVAHYGKKYPTEYITGCRLCSYSYCE